MHGQRPLFPHQIHLRIGMEMRQTQAEREEENGPEGGRTRTPTPAARQQNINDGATRTRRLDIERVRRRGGGGADVATCMEWAALGWVCRDLVLSFWFTHSLVYKGWLITDED